MSYLRTFFDYARLAQNETENPWDAKAPFQVAHSFLNFCLQCSFSLSHFRFSLSSISFATGRTRMSPTTAMASTAVRTMLKRPFTVLTFDFLFCPLIDVLSLFCLCVFVRSLFFSRPQRSSARQTTSFASAYSAPCMAFLVPILALS